MLELLDTVKTALRIKSTAFDDEIELTIDACQIDMKLAGVDRFIETDHLCVQAVILYCKANFGHPDKEEAARWQARYEAVRDQMATSSDYGGA